MPELIAPTVRLHAAWLEAHEEWGPGLHEDGFGLRTSDEVGSPAGFATWVAGLVVQEDTATPARAGRVHCTYRWIVENGQVLGAIALRHEFSDFVRQAGHLVYGIRPSARTIERHGAILEQMSLEEIRQTSHGSFRRYWIML